MEQSCLSAIPRSLRRHLKSLICTLVFCAGEMLDWEAPTGGYLMTACFASGKKAGEGVLVYLGVK